MARTRTLVALATLASCITPDPSRLPPPPVETTAAELAPTAAPPRGTTELVGASIEGRPIAIAIFEPGAAGAHTTAVLVLASIHGDESAGTPLCERLVDELERQPRLGLDRRVVVVPRVNPDGLARGARHNARGVDLNRNFPASNFHVTGAHGPEPLSEPESRVVADLIQRFEPDRILSFHQPVGAIDYDGPAHALAAALAAVGPLPVRRLGARPGSLGSWAGVDLGVPTITVELPRAAGRDGPDALWERYGPMLRAAIELD